MREVMVVKEEVFKKEETYRRTLRYMQLLSEQKKEKDKEEK